MAAEDDAKELQAAIFRMVTSFRRQRGESLSNGAMERHAQAPVAARHMGAAERLVESGPLTVGALAEALQIELTTASKIATELEAAGIIERERDPADRRRILLAVVPEWRDRVQASMAELREPLVNAVEQLSEDEIAAFYRGLTLYAEELDKHDMASPPEAGY